MLLVLRMLLEQHSKNGQVWLKTCKESQVYRRQLSNEVKERRLWEQFQEEKPYIADIYIRNPAGTIALWGPL